VQLLEIPEECEHQPAGEQVPVVVKVVVALMYLVCDLLTGPSLTSALGFSQTSAIGSRLRVAPEQRSGGPARACS